MFPSIDIHTSPSTHASHRADDLSNLAKSSISCETDYQHQCETILVVSDLSSITVSIDPSSTVGGAWLIESRGR